MTIPANAAPGNCLLQVIEWMLPHASDQNNGIQGCFYDHCANIQVVEADAGIVDGGVVVVDAGSLPGDTTDDGGAGTSGSDDASADDPDVSGTNTGRRRSSTPTSEGCGVSSANGASLCGPLIGALAAVRVLRRRKRR